MKIKSESFIYTIVYIIILLLAVAWAGSFVSCTTTRNARKDAKAFSRVISNDNLFERAGERWEAANPCLQSTVIPGKDSIRIDTVFNNDFTFGEDSVRVDTLESVITKTIIKKVPVYITKTSLRVDTVQDLRRINLLNQDLAKEKGKIEQVQKMHELERKRGNKWMGLFIGLIGLNALIVSFKLRKGFIK